MSSNWADLINKLEEPATPADLRLKITNRILVAEIGRARRRLGAALVFMVLSVGFFIAAMPIVSEEFSRTNFFRYLSMFFSDGASVLAYWRDFFSVLIESLPLTSLIVFSFSLWLIFWISRVFSKNWEAAFRSGRLLKI